VEAFTWNRPLSLGHSPKKDTTAFVNTALPARVQADEGRLQEERKALASLQAERTKRTNELAALRQAEKEISLREAGYRAQARNLDAKIASLDAQVCVLQSSRTSEKRSCFRPVFAGWVFKLLMGKLSSDVVLSPH
jgi:chromosome segregation ATPase